MPETAVLYAWMLPYYAGLRREKFDWTLKDAATQWAWLQERINGTTENRFAIALEDVTRAGRQADALESLDTMWTTVCTKP